MFFYVEAIGQNWKITGVRFEYFEFWTNYFIIYVFLMHHSEMYLKV